VGTKKDSEQNQQDVALAHPPERILGSRIKAPDSTSDSNEIIWGQADVDKAGRVKASLVVSLDYFPSSRPNIATLPRCMAPLSDDFELGKIVCLQGSAEIILSAKYVNQECFAGTDKVKKVSQVALKMENCARVSFIGYRFDPEIRLQVDTKI
jgi:hypothetical protein